MEHKLPQLPFAKDALAPNISAETLEYHYGKHHQAYVTNLNKLIAGTDLENLPLEEIITGQAGVRRVVSRTREGVSTITVQYDWGTDMDFANLHLREAIDRVAYRDDFPESADRPLILRWDPGARPIAILVMGGDDPLERMTDFARDVHNGKQHTTNQNSDAAPFDVGPSVRHAVRNCHIDPPSVFARFLGCVQLHLA